MKLFIRFLKEEDAATAIEYGLICALIALIAIAAMQAIGTSLVNLFNQIAGLLTR